MKTITKYQAVDGQEFETKERCLAHERLVSEINALMARLPKLPENDGCRFANGEGYLQHEQESFWAVRDELLRIAMRFSDHHWLSQAAHDRAAHPSFPGRIIGELAAPLRDAWYRIMCVDQKLREWGQPYYANNPPSAPSLYELEQRA